MSTRVYRSQRLQALWDTSATEGPKPGAKGIQVAEAKAL
jgi:hypothetical protein